MNGMQENRPAVRRRLTPQQRKVLERKRRIRKIKKNLKYIVPAAAILVAAIILTIVLAGKGGRKDVEPAAAITEPEPIEIISAGETDLYAAEPDAVEADEIPSEPEQDRPEEPEQVSQDEPAPEAPAQETAVPEATDMLLSPEQEDAFNYETAYVRAVLGGSTGPSLNTLDYSAVDPAKTNRWPEIDPDTLPILVQGANMEENAVCITIDDCFQADNLRSIVQCAKDNGGKITIFPIGKNLEKSEIAESVKWAWENGMEIENHTYNHVGLYHYDDERMTNELWYQSCRLSMVLGVNYRQHFFRPHGGDERKDQRVQAYCAQLGLYGIAHWTIDGSKSSVSESLSNLKPGSILLFHSTDNDLKLLRELIPEIAARGYKLVTLNEMFGLPDNETSDLATLDINAKPEFKAFRVTVPSLKKTAYSRASAVVQKRMIELGWLEGKADGEFGTNSYLATGFFQVASGLKGTGVADPETQAAMFASNAERATPERLAEMKKQYESYKN